MDKTRKIIESLSVTSNISDLNSLGADVTALKVAFCLIFKKLDDSHRETLLEELKQTNTDDLNELARQLEQFRV